MSARRMNVDRIRGSGGEAQFTSASGQILVIVAGGLLVLIAMVGLIIDGGHAWGQQRKTQNSADGVAMAGAAVVQQWLADSASTLDAGDVGCAVEAAAAAHVIGLERAEFTNHTGNLLSPSVEVPACGSAVPIPGGAQGVKATASEDFDTFIIRSVGFATLTATAEATAVVGTPAGICAAADGCMVLPVTFPRTVDTCDGTSTRIIGESEWVIQPENAVLTDSNLSIVPLCKKGPGAVGWLDFGCGNLSDHITNPCNTFIPIPAWLDTSPGNPNCCEGELNAYTGVSPGVPEEEDLVVYIPIHDYTCEHDLADPQPTSACSTHPDWSGNGNNFHYHVPYWVGFKLDGAFVQGNDRECNELPGSPFAGGNGATGCLKGWFVSKVTAPGAVTTGPINPGDPVALAITLIR
jgi:hypothetical protein